MNTFIRLLKLIPRRWRLEKRRIERKEQEALYIAILAEHQAEIDEIVKQGDVAIASIKRNLHAIDMITACRNN